VTGKFELLEPSRGAFKFRLVSPAGKVLAVSGTYSDKDSAVAAIRLARESAATAIVQDHTTEPPQPPAPWKTKSRHNQGAPSRWFG
jgi:uncharacterized protein YegP (UPF0339 family)